MVAKSRHRLPTISDNCLFKCDSRNAL